MKFESNIHLENYISKIVYNNTSWRCNGDVLSRVCCDIFYDNYHYERKVYSLIRYAKNTKYNFDGLSKEEMRYRFNKYIKYISNN